MLYPLLLSLLGGLFWLCVICTAFMIREALQD